MSEQENPIELPPGQPLQMVPGQMYTTHVNLAPGTTLGVGDVWWQNVPSPAPWQQPVQLTTSPVPSLDEIRQLVREEVQKELYPGAIDPRMYRHVDVTDSDGKRWRGMVYRVEPGIQEEG